MNRTPFSSPTATPSQQSSPEHDPLMKFGKFRGSKICDLPDDYLLWLSCLDLRPPLVGYVLKEMARRLAEKDRQGEREESWK
jgi:uncharacterized protein (DUF3820 family)